MDEKNKKLLANLVASALFICAGISLIVLPSNTIVKVCGAGLVAIELTSVARMLIKRRK